MLTAAKEKVTETVTSVMTTAIATTINVVEKIDPDAAARDRVVSAQIEPPQQPAADKAPAEVQASKGESAAAEQEESKEVVPTADNL